MLGKVLLIGGAGVVALGAIGDMAVRSVAESRIAERAEAAGGDKADAEAEIDSFPFVPRLLFGGKAGDVSVRVEDAVAGNVQLARIDLDLEGVEIDRGKLLTDRKAEMTDVDVARITMHVDVGMVSRAFGGLQVSFGERTVQASFAGRTVSAAIEVAAGGRLAITFPGGPSATIRLPRTDLVACEASDFRVEGDEVLVSCSTDEVPPALLRAVQAT